MKSITVLEKKTKTEKVIEISVGYEDGKGGIFGGRGSQRGYYLYATPVKIERAADSAVSFRSFNMFEGRKKLLLPVNRQGAGAQEKAVELGKAEAEDMAKRVADIYGLRLEGEVPEDSVPIAGGMRMVRIDAKFKEVYEVYCPKGDTLSFLQKHAAGGGTVDLVRLPQKMDLWVDDEGLLKNPEYFYMIEGCPAPLAADGLLASSDNEGETIALPASITLEEIRGKVKWHSRYSALEYAKKAGI
jgi:hypothetical protein